MPAKKSVATKKPIAKRRRGHVDQSGGFLGPLVSMLAPAVLPMLGQMFSGKGKAPRKMKGGLELRQKTYYTPPTGPIHLNV